MYFLFNYDIVMIIILEGVDFDLICLNWFCFKIVKKYNEIFLYWRMSCFDENFFLYDYI